MFRLERLRDDHAPELLRFETENRSYFARSIPDRGDDYFAEFGDRHKWLLELQDAGTDHFHVILDGDRIIGRVNLVEAANGSAALGYRIAESATGKGLATWAVREACPLARTQYALTRLTAKTTTDNLASQKVLLRTGFHQTGDTDLNGKPGFTYALDLGES
jgi:ribosomal-protein-alanine N-acetyltransferase